MFSCLVDKRCVVYARVSGWPELEAIFRVHKGDCVKYVYNLETRRMKVTTNCSFMVTKRHYLAAKDFFENSVGTPEKLIGHALEGHLSESMMFKLLKVMKREDLYGTFVSIAKQFTKDCPSHNGSCVEEGCPFTDERICIKPIMSKEYHRACAAAWAELFKIPANRIKVWRTI